MGLHTNIERFRRISLLNSITALRNYRGRLHEVQSVGNAQEAKLRRFPGVIEEDGVLSEVSSTFRMAKMPPRNIATLCVQPHRVGRWLKHAGSSSTSTGCASGPMRTTDDSAYTVTRSSISSSLSTTRLSLSRATRPPS